MSYSDRPLAKAAALKYDANQDNAPKLVAKAQGHLAEKIIQLAKEHNISIFQNKALADSLLDLNVDEEIPPRLYQVTVELFAWLIKVEQQHHMAESTT